MKVRTDPENRSENRMKVRTDPENRIGVPDFINSLNEMSVDSGYFIYKAPPESSSE